MKIYNSSKFNKLPNGILFDTDNTLYPYDPAHNAAFEALINKLSKNFSIEKNQFVKFYNEARKDVKDRLGSTASSHSRLLYIQRMLEKMGLGSQVLTVLDLEQTYWRTFLNNANLFDGVLELLDEIRLLGIPISIVTDLTAQIQFRKVVYFGLDKYFENIVTSEEAGNDKPHKSTFKLAVEKMNLDGDLIWMIGDNPVNDIGGAKKAINAVTIQKIHKGITVGEDENKPDATFKDYKLLKKLIINLYKNESK